MDNPKRKNLRWQAHNYSSDGNYFLTICSKGKQCIFSNIVRDVNGTNVVCLTDIGRIVEKNIISGNNIEFLTIEHYVIMPNHIHIMVSIKGSPVKANDISKTRSDEIIFRYEATLKRFSNKQIGENVFQRSGIDRVVRGDDEYNRIVKYIYENPQKWCADKYYSNEVQTCRITNQSL